MRVVAWSDGVANDWAEAFETDALADDFIFKMNAAHGEDVVWVGYWEIPSARTVPIQLDEHGFIRDDYEWHEAKLKEISS